MLDAERLVDCSLYGVMPRPMAAARILRIRWKSLCISYIESTSNVSECGDVMQPDGPEMKTPILVLYCASFSWNSY
jgi:hypothetical protein